MPSNAAADAAKRSSLRTKTPPPEDVEPRQRSVHINDAVDSDRVEAERSSFQRIDVTRQMTSTSDAAADTSAAFDPAVLGRSVAHYNDVGTKDTLGVTRTASPMPPPSGPPAVAATDMSGKIFTHAEFAFHKVRIVGDTGGTEMQEAAPSVQSAVDIRRKYTRQLWPQLPSFAPVESPVEADSPDTLDAQAVAGLSEDTRSRQAEDGVVLWSEQASALPTYEEWVCDLQAVHQAVEEGPARSSCKARLRLLETKVRMHSLLNDDLEEYAAAASGRSGGGGALGSCVRVDTRTRLASAVQATDLVTFAREVLGAPESLDVRIPVREVDGVGMPCTCPPGTQSHPLSSCRLTSVLRRVGIHPDQLTVERLALQFSPRLPLPEELLFGCSSDKRPKGVAPFVLPLLLTPTAGGACWGRLIKRQIDDLTGKTGGCAAEYAIYIHGTSKDELPALARWLHSQSLLEPSRPVRYFLELRRPYAGCGAPSYAAWLENIFVPLADASLPCTSEDSALALFMKMIGGVTVSSSKQTGIGEHYCPPPPSPPSAWRSDATAPPFNWLAYHVWANVTSVSRLRRARGLNGLEFRPRCGHRDGEFRTLCPAYILAGGVIGAAQITHSAVLQYLYFVSQVPIHMCPSSSAALGEVASISEHPLPLLLRRGLRVTLGTDDPVFLGAGAKPLDEEYRTALKLWKLTAAEIGEISRNSVVFSTFPVDMKTKWLGQDYKKGFRGNASSKSSVPTMRLVFRDSQFQQEVRTLARCCLSIAADMIASPDNSRHVASPLKRTHWHTILTTSPMATGLTPGAQFQPASFFPETRGSRGDRAEPKMSSGTTTGGESPAVRDSVRLESSQKEGSLRRRGSGILKDSAASPRDGSHLGAIPLNRRASHIGSFNLLRKASSGAFPAWALPRAHDGVTPRHKSPDHRVDVREAEAFLTKYSQFAVAEEAEPYVEYHRIEISGPPQRQRYSHCADAITKALQLRKKYLWKPQVQVWEQVKNQGYSHGIVWEGSGHVEFKEGLPKLEGWTPPGDSALPTLEEYCDDLTWLHDLTYDGQLSSFAASRLELLEQRFKLHTALNALNEDHARDTTEINIDDVDDALEEVDAGDGKAQKDFYRAYKVDTHVHMAAGMTARMLLEFMKVKYEKHGHDIVKVGALGRVVTLQELLRDHLAVDMTALSVNMLNVQADATLFERFDNFNNKYNPIGNGELREVFLKTDNFMGGRYFAELIKSTFDRYAELDERSFSEMRLSIYGRKPTEWGTLARWSNTFGMIHRHNRWMIQVPRLYHVWRKHGAVKCFGDVLRNIFEPLWKVSIDPASDPALAFFLQHVSGFDSVDNEASVDPPLTPISPDAWTESHNPPYAYWMYYMWANIRLLNQFREAHNLNTFSLRPHAGEAGELIHLSACFLTSEGIAHGINLAKTSLLEYLYYLARVPLYVSPLSNNSLFLEYVSNPFPRFFRRGLNVSLSTDDPLQFHQTAEPLIEEYSVASKVWRLSTADMCEIARNSVLHSGFLHEQKKEWIGGLYFLDSSRGNQADLTHVDDIRITYRYETYHDEIKAITSMRGEGSGSVPAALLTLDEEDAILQHPGLADASRKRSVVKSVKSGRRSTTGQTTKSVKSSQESGSLQAQAMAEKDGELRNLSDENAKLRTRIQELELHVEVLDSLNPRSPDDSEMLDQMRKCRANPFRAFSGTSTQEQSGLSTMGTPPTGSGKGTTAVPSFGDKTASVTIPTPAEPPKSGSAIPQQVLPARRQSETSPCSKTVAQSTFTTARLPSLPPRTVSEDDDAGDEWVEVQCSPQTQKGTGRKSSAPPAPPGIGRDLASCRPRPLAAALAGGQSVERPNSAPPVFSAGHGGGKEVKKREETA
eukprot:Hpha_TRINITY_DN10038_c0_g1::TRINITY_DN10038_c0_g1_i1::g.83957::m.83957/K01490/AMPD; AMP deaminase